MTSFTHKQLNDFWATNNAKTDRWSTSHHGTAFDALKSTIQKCTRRANLRDGMSAMCEIISLVVKAVETGKKSVFTNIIRRVMIIISEDTIDSPAIHLAYSIEIHLERLRSIRCRMDDSSDDSCRKIRVTCSVSEKEDIVCALINIGMIMFKNPMQSVSAYSLISVCLSYIKGGSIPDDSQDLQFGSSGNLVDLISCTLFEHDKKSGGVNKKGYDMGLQLWDVITTECDPDDVKYLVTPYKNVWEVHSKTHREHFLWPIASILSILYSQEPDYDDNEEYTPHTPVTLKGAVKIFLNHMGLPSYKTPHYAMDHHVIGNHSKKGSREAKIRFAEVSLIFTNEVHVVPWKDFHINKILS